jgi:Phage tail assembly chaperone protein
MDFWVDTETLVIRASGPTGYECSFEGQDACVKVVANTNQLKAKAVKNADGSFSIIENPDLSALYVDLRARRSKLLAESDWTQNRDCVLPVEKQDAWAAYRKALRDLPSNTQDPTQVVWPTPPS